MITEAPDVPTQTLKTKQKVHNKIKNFHNK